MLYSSFCIYVMCFLLFGSYFTFSSVDSCVYTVCTLYSSRGWRRKNFYELAFFLSFFPSFDRCVFCFLLRIFLAQYFKWIPLSRISPNSTLNITPNSNTNIKYSIHLIFFNAMLKNVYIWHRVHSISLPLMEVHNIRHSQ